jgi:hypothetical protein
MTIDECLSSHIARFREAEQVAGKDLIGPPAAHAFDWLRPLDAALLLVCLEDDQAIWPGSLGNEGTVTGDNELHAGEHLAEAKADVALPDRVEVGIDFIDQDNTLHEDSKARSGFLDAGLQVESAFEQVPQHVDGQGEETARAVVK